jgi:hypothetical protein
MNLYRWFFMDMQIGHIAIIRHIYDKDNREYVLGEVISDVEWWTHDMHQVSLQHGIPLCVFEHGILGAIEKHRYTISGETC